MATATRVRGARGFVRLATVSLAAITTAVVVIAAPAGAAPGDWTVSPTVVDLGFVAVGDTVGATVTVLNVSAVAQSPVITGGQVAAPLTLAAENCTGATIGPGGSCSFVYEFTPTAIGAIGQSPDISIDGETFGLVIAGFGVSPYSVSPTTHDFGDHYLGDFTYVDVIITNVATIATHTPQFAGGAIDPPFASQTFCGGVTLNPGGTCYYRYTYTPTTAGLASETTTIQIDGESFTISLSGNALEPWSVAPTALDFGEVPVGSVAEIDAVLTNNGLTTTGVNFTGGAVNPPLSVDSDCSGLTVFSQGESCSYVYTFAPTAAGSVSAATTIEIDGKAFPITLTGVGVGVAPGPGPCVVVVADDSYDVQAGETLHVDPPGPGTNDTLCPGSELVVIDDADHGSLTLLASGDLTYTPEPGFVGTDSFSYGVVEQPSGFAAASVRRPSIPIELVATVTLDVTEPPPSGDPTTTLGTTTTAPPSAPDPAPSAPSPSSAAPDSPVSGGQLPATGSDLAAGLIVVAAATLAIGLTTLALGRGSSHHRRRRAS